MEKEFLKLGTVDMYKLLLNGTISRLPYGFWNEMSVAEVIRWLFDEKLCYDDEGILENASRSFFKEYGLDSMLYAVYNRSIIDALESAYPGRFKPWQFRRVPNGYWTKETAKEAVNWLVEEKLKITDDELILEYFDEKILSKYGMGTMFSNLFQKNIYLLFENAYPGRLKPWQFKRVPNEYWNKETAKQAVRWLIEEKLKITDDEQILERINCELFNSYGLRSMLNLVFNSSPYEALNATYPGRFKAWELKITQKRFWNMQNGVEAIHWLVEEKLKVMYCDIPKYVTHQAFINYHLGYMLNVVFDGDYRKAIKTAYPNLKF